MPQLQEVFLLWCLRGCTKVCIAVVPSVPGSASLCVHACPRDAVRPRVACISDDLSPYYVRFSKQNFVFLLLLFLISSGPFHLPTPSFTPHFIKVLFDPFFQVTSKKKKKISHKPGPDPVLAPSVGQ